MKASQVLPPVFAGLTLVLLGTNAVPATVRKGVLLKEKTSLEKRYDETCRRGEQLNAELRALREDSFVLERWFLETWNQAPDGTIAWDAPVAAPEPDELGDPAE